MLGRAARTAGRTTTTVLVLCASAVLLLRGASAASARRDVGARAQRVLSEGYQTELPGVRPEQGDAARERLAPSPPPEADQGGSVGGSAVAYALLIAVSIALLAGLGLWLWQTLRGDAGPVQLLPGESPAPAQALDLEQPLSDADGLARAGQFAAAIHVLLGRTLAELARVRTVTLQPSWTSREVLSRLGGQLPVGARLALAGLIGTVEVCWFGDDEPTANDYARCVEQFQHVVREVVA